MKQKIFGLGSLCILILVIGFVTPSHAQTTDLGQVKAGEFDNGKMWTFDYPPLELFKKLYDFEPDAAWFEKAMLGALRLPNCTASFVSPRGLVLTNNHCGRGSVAQVSEPGESLLTDGFTSGSLDEERPVEGLYVDQLIAIEDVTDEIYAALDDKETDAEKAAARQEAIQATQARVLENAGGTDAGMVVEVIDLYSGGRYSAYTFRRFSDIRLVMTPELQLGYFGGDTDNFTYPRYALDMTFFRVYENGEPYEPEHYFKWSLSGAQEGDAVFVLGNPGSTLRLLTLAQLEWRRDVQEKDIVRLLQSRIAVMQEYYAENPSDGLLNQIFGLRNSEKLYVGRVKGLNDPVIMAKRTDTEMQFLEDLTEKFGDMVSTDVQVPYMTLIDDLAELQIQKRVYAAEFGSFLAFSPGNGLASSTLQHAVLVHDYLSQKDAGVTDEALSQMQEQIVGLGYQARGLDEGMLVARLNDFVHYFGETDPDVQAFLQGRSTEEVAAFIMENSALASAETITAAFESGSLSMDDPAVAAVAPFLARRQAYQSAFAGLAGQENELNAQHGRARYEVYGTSRPPDATFSLRIADGVVSSYDYNGSHAPAFTTFHGLYNRHFSHAQDANGTGEWALPDRWLNAPPEFDRSTPLNFVSTNDIIGGNSGSPMVNKDLEIVGLIFDGNIESLPSAFIYQTEGARTVSVDARGILEALDAVFDMDRIVLELTTGQAVATEAEADAIRE